MPDGVLVADIETKQFVRCNAAMRATCSASRKNELLSRSVMDIHPADELPSVLETFHALVDGRQRVGHDIPMLRKDGSVFHADVTHNEIELDGRRCTVGLLPRHQPAQRAEEALRQSRDELQSIYDGMVDGLHILNLATRRADRSNPAMCRMMGYSQEELLSLSQAEAHPPNELPGILQRFQRTSRAGLRWRRNCHAAQRRERILCRRHDQSDFL